MHIIDVAYCNRRHTYHSLTVCTLVTWMCRAKMAEPIKMLFKVKSVGPRNHISDGSPHSPHEGAVFGVVRPTKSILSHCHYYTT